MSYPYPVAAWPQYIFSSGHAHAWPADIDLSGRTPVLAVGSNRSPEQLRRKYGDDSAAVIPVSPVVIDDFDVAYSSYLTYYGSVPATLIPAPGHKTQMAVTWLTPAQLHLMHSTESVGRHTQYGTIAAPATGWQTAGQRIDRIWTYASLRGLLPKASDPLLLDAIKSQNRVLPSATQREVLVWVHETYGQGDFTDWLQTIITDEDQRLELNTRIAASALPTALPDFVVE